MWKGHQTFVKEKHCFLGGAIVKSRVRKAWCVKPYYGFPVLRLFGAVYRGEKNVPGSGFAAGDKNNIGSVSPRAILFFRPIAPQAILYLWLVFSPQAIFFRLEKVFCVLISSSTLYLGLASSFGVGYFTSYYESSTETAAVFLCLRTKQASSPAARNGRGNP